MNSCYDNGILPFSSIMMVIETKSSAPKFQVTIKTELGAGERIPIFFFKSPPLRAVIVSDKVKISSISKTCDMSDRPARCNGAGISITWEAFVGVTAQLKSQSQVSRSTLMIYLDSLYFG